MKDTTDKISSPQSQAKLKNSALNVDEDDDSETADSNHNAMSILAQVADSTLQV